MAAEPSIDHEIRSLAKALGPPPNRRINVSLLQGVVASEDGGTVSLYVQNEDEVTSDWPYLLDGYAPEVGDIVWIIDGGPASKFVIGVLKRA